LRILVVEDDRQLREAVARGLREAAYAVDQAEDGEQALERVASTEYDALVLDILLPGKNGIEVCRAIRASERHVPILMLTALDSLDDKIAGLDAGADDYLTKPFEFGELLARVRALTRRRGEVLLADLVVGDLVIDTLHRTARRGERVIALTTKEFAFLEYLARHANRVVSRADIMAHVWDEGYNPFSNLIDVYASRLRRKIDDEGETPLFTTHRAVGYMLAATPTTLTPRRATAPSAATGTGAPSRKKSPRRTR
jgi:two-component system copper resistance phosphate regulon response regulator CusR